MTDPPQDEIAQWTMELAEIDAKIDELNDRKEMIHQVLEAIPVIEKLRGKTSEGEAKP